MDRIIKYLNFLLQAIPVFFKYSIAFIISKFVKRLEFYKDVWLISERGYDARDNSYHLYKYIKLNHKDINIKYVIDKKSADLNKIIEFDNYVQYGSMKHYILFILANKLISTHIMGYSPHTEIFTILEKKRLIKIKGKKCFLQHGIIQAYIEGLCYPNVELDLFVCGAKPEYEFIKNNYNFQNSVVKYLGLCRFDNLHSIKTKKQILVMPTWRKWLNNCSNIDEFKKSDYFIKYDNVLKDKKLKDLLNTFDYELIFYPHYEFQKYINAFQQIGSEIKIANFKDYDVQKLLIESEVLITDYSSVYFDFAYMKKPILYYQFDYDKFCKSHYQKGYFDYEVDGFGKIVKNEEEMINELEYILKNFSLYKEEYDKRSDKFFELYDRNNCKRTFDIIKNL